MRGGFPATLVALLASAPALLQSISSLSVMVQASEYFEGEGTTYTLSDPNNGNCNFMAYPEDAVTKYAALNTEQWDATKNCGRCAEVTCTDARCSKATKSSEIVHIVDQCPGCVLGDLDLSPSVYKAITGFEGDRLKIKWKFVDCPLTTKIKYCLKKGSNPFWAAIQPTNFVAGVASVKVNGQKTTMVDSAYYFLLDGKSETKADLSNIKITVLGVNGEEIEDTVSFANSDCVEGKSQFKADNSASQNQNQNQQQTTTVPPVASAPPPPAPPAQTGAAPVPSPVAPSAVATGTAEPQVTPIAPISQLLGTILNTNSTKEVAGEADRAAVSDDNGDDLSTKDNQESGTITASPPPAPVSDSKSTPPPSSGTTNNNDDDGVSQIKTETEGSNSKTSPAVIVLSAFGCVAAVVLIALAVYVNKKKLDDKRADRAEGSSFALAVPSSINSSIDVHGSFCEVTTPGGTKRGVLNVAAL